MANSKLTVEQNNGIAKMAVVRPDTEGQGKSQARVLAYKLSKELKNNRILKDAILQTIGFVESTGGCEESIRMLRKALSEVHS